MRKQILTAILLITIAIGSLSRLSIAGWFFIIGILSIIIFGTIHIILHYNIIKYGSNLKRTDLILTGISHILYLNLFLFQSDGGDDRAYIIIEYITGKFSSFELEQYASAIFIVSLILYFIIAAILFLRIRISNSTFSKKKLKFAILFIVLVTTLPIGIIYLSAKARNLNDIKADEKLGRYETLRRALKNKENVRYLRLYKYPNSYTSIPKGVFELYNLEELELYSNEIELIPADISLLKKLKILDLQYNQINSIPDEVGLLSGLETLILMNNNIDSVNPKICNCLNLKKLYLGGKSLKSIPNCLSKMPRLEKLVVQSDSINNFMEDFKQFKNLKELTLFTFENSIRDNKKYLELEKVLPNTKMDIPSSVKNK